MESTERYITSNPEPARPSFIALLLGEISESEYSAQQSAWESWLQGYLAAVEADRLTSMES